MYVTSCYDSVQVLEPSDTGLTFEGLIDALLVLYEECGHDRVKSKSEVVAGFLAKFQTVVHNYDRLRVNIGDFQVKRVIGRGIGRLAAEYRPVIGLVSVWYWQGIRQVSARYQPGISQILAGYRPDIGWVSARISASYWLGISRVLEIRSIKGSSLQLMAVKV